MQNPIPYFKIKDYEPQQPDTYKLRVIKTPEALLRFRKEYVARNNSMGSSIYYATDEFDRNFVIKEYRTDGLKGDKRSKPRSVISKFRTNALADLTVQHERLLHLGSEFGPWGLCLNNAKANRCTRAYSFQKILKGSLVDVLPTLNATGASAYDIARFVGTDVARDLVRVHERDVIHFDVKPENICLAGSKFVLIDYDISAQGVASGLVRGTTREYAPPEQIVGDRISSKADIFPLGLVLGELAQGDGFRLLGRMDFTEAGETRTDYVRLKHYLDYRSMRLEEVGERRVSHFRHFDASLQTHPRLYDLVLGCTDPDASRRPTAQQVLTTLTTPPLAPSERVTERLRAACAALPELSPLFAAHRTKLQAAVAAAAAGDPQFGRRS